MNSDKTNSPDSDSGKQASVKKVPPARGTPPPVPVTPPLFRRIDWISFAVTTVLVFIGYFLTVAPDLTLEDSGELAVGSFYAGVPHPPGYPVWTLYTWLFTVLLPVSNIAYRVALSSAVAGALSCGLIALMVSRGSSMILESIGQLKGIQRDKENWLCLVCGFFAGLVFGFNGFFWSQAVIVEVYTFSVLSLTLVLCTLLRWMYAPHQRRYIYWSFFLFGVSFTNHQTLIVGAMGIQIAVMLAQPKLGRDLFAWNTVFFFAGLLAKAKGKLTSFDNVQAVNELGQTVSKINPLFIIYLLIGIGSMVGCIWLVIKTQKFFTEWKTTLISGLMFVLGAAFYFYMPLASMTNPPMNWGYPRTAEGFVHAFTRGQYEKTHPTDNIGRLADQVVMYAESAAEEFNVVYLLVAFVPFFFLRRMQPRERAWLLGLTAIWFFLAMLLMVLLNPSTDKQSRDLTKVFFTASYVMVAMSIGYGLAIIGGLLLTQYETYRRWAKWGAAIASAIALFYLSKQISFIFETRTEQTGIGLFFYGLGQAFTGQNTIDIFPGIFLLFLTLSFLLLLVFGRSRFYLTAALVLFAIAPTHLIVSHWADNEQRNHRFGYWFGHDMFIPPFNVFPEMERDTVLFGGTDPGRFNPTYMIFCEGFIPPEKRFNPEFDRRDVYLITQNALADGTYLSYIRAHYNRSAQVDPPFFQNFFKTPAAGIVLAILVVLYAIVLFWPRFPFLNTIIVSGAIGVLVIVTQKHVLEWLDTTFIALGENIEKKRRAGTSYFKDDHFIDLPGFAAKLRDQSDPVSKFIFNNLRPETQPLLSSGDEKKLRAALVTDLNNIIDRPAKEESLYSPERFEGVKLSDHSQRFIKENPQGYTRIRWARLLLEDAYPKEIAKSIGGVYPNLEIKTPSPEDSQIAFNQYIEDAQRRYQIGQMKPGENFTVQDGRVQVSGQVAVMSINGILTKMIFDANPNHEFYVEESFPLDWMYPYLTPNGIIMKINRNPLPELTQEIVDKDHEFWSKYSDRLIGNWITYDTTVKEICDFAVRTYLHHDYKGFIGDRKFVRDDNAQKAFSKLRSSIGGVYAWRVANAKSNPEQQRMIKEAEFAFKQAFAYCPYSPEAVYRYVNLLLSMQRFDDAIAIVQTCKRIDPNNAQIEGLLLQIEDMKVNALAGRTPQAQSAFGEAIRLFQSGKTNEAMKAFDSILQSENSDPQALMGLAQAFVQLGQIPRAEVAVQKLVTLSPSNAEAWYNLGGLQAAQGKLVATQAMAKAFALSDERLKKDPKALDLRKQARTDPNLSPLKNDPQFQKLLEK